MIAEPLKRSTPTWLGRCLLALIVTAGAAALTASTLLAGTQVTPAGAPAGPLPGPTINTQSPAAPRGGRQAMSALSKAQPGDVRMIVTGSMVGPIDDLRVEMQRAVGHPIVVQYGSARGDLRTEILGGQGFEVAILLPDVTDELHAAGRVTSAYVDIARVNIGIAIRGDVPPMDVSTPAAIKVAILGAKALEWSPTGVAIKTVNKMLDALDIRDQVAKTWHPSRQPVLVPLGPGEYELQIFPLSEIIDRKVARNLGPVIPEFQVPQVIRAVISANTPEPRSAEAVLDFLQRPEVTAVLAKHGMTR